MNKIVIDKEKIVLDNITKKLVVKYNRRDSEFGISTIDIYVKRTCDLYLDVTVENSKYVINFYVEDNNKLYLYEIKQGDKSKIQYNFYLKYNSYVRIDKFNYCINNKEMILVNLEEENSKIYYNLKGITRTKDNYDMIINHNAKNTISNIKNNIVNIENGKVSYQISSYVDLGNINVNSNQASRIINLTNNLCEIKPNLYIEEYDSVANHSALVGSFNEDELFYLQSRGISKEMANKLLIRGFLLSDIENKEMIKKINNIINEYWR